MFFLLDAILLRRATITNTITTNKTPAMMRMVVVSTQIPSVQTCATEILLLASSRNIHQNAIGTNQIIASEWPEAAKSGPISSTPDASSSAPMVNDRRAPTSDRIQGQSSWATAMPINTLVAIGLPLTSAGSNCHLDKVFRTTSARRS